MSLGAWTLSGFSSAVGFVVVCHERILAGYGYEFLSTLEWVAEILTALSGLILVSYTSVLLGVTAIPVWSENRRLVPVVFLTGAMGSTAAVLELFGFLVPATQFLGVVASLVEIVIAILIELRDRYVDRPPREGAVELVDPCWGHVSWPLRFATEDLSGAQPRSPLHRSIEFLRWRTDRPVCLDRGWPSLFTRSSGALPNSAT
jgi:hypothetical protein